MLVIWAWLGLQGAQRLVWWWCTRRPLVAPERAMAPVPVLVQLPMYKEERVALRVVDAALALQWPKDLLHVQVLDDTPQGGMAMLRDHVHALAEQGASISYVHRTHRRGFKAGALAEGMALRQEPFVAIFDADFVPPTTWLRETMAWMTPGIGMVQTRWGHLAVDSWLRRVQALLLDAHFGLEHGGRQALGCWFNFNGTGGVWRRDAIEAAGGWQGDTITEDLDLSFRSQMAGYRFRYVHQIVAPGELPASWAAFAQQQERWALGGGQVARKLLGPVAGASAPWWTRLEALSHLLTGFSYVVVVGLAAFPPSAAEGGQSGLWGLLLALFLVSHGLVQWREHRRVALGELFSTLGVVVAMAPRLGWAFLRGWFGAQATFRRTPKGGAVDRPSGAAWPLGMGVWSAYLAVLALWGLVVGDPLGALVRGAGAAAGWALLRGEERPQGTQAQHAEPR